MPPTRSLRMELPPAAPRLDGLAWAFAFLPGSMPALGDPRPPGGPGWDWLHYDLVHSNARAAIEADRSFPAFMLRLLVGADETPQIVTDGEVVAGVLPSFVRSAGADEHEIAWWRFAMRPDRLVTSRRRPVRALTAVWDGIASGHAPEGPVALLDGAIAEFAREARRRVAKLDDELERRRGRAAGPAPLGRSRRAWGAAWPGPARSDHHQARPRAARPAAGRGCRRTAGVGDARLA